MEIDPRLAGPPAGSKAPSFVTRIAGTGNGGASPAPSLPNHQAHSGGSIGAGRPLGFPAAPPLTSIQNTKSVLTTPNLASGTPQGPTGLASTVLDQKRPRACESCRGLKVRCEPNEQNPFATCKRCAKANRECVFTAPSRKRQKKSDSKVAELEKKIDALTASLHAQQAKAAHADDDDDDDEDYLDDGNTQAPSDALRPGVLELSPISRPSKRQRSEDAQAGGHDLMYPKGSRIPTTSHIRPADGDANKYVYIDVVDRKLLSMETATAIFNHYVEDMVPHFPAVVFPADTTAEDVRRKKPTLFLAILAAASGTSDPNLHKTLYIEISRTFAERIMFNGEKSLELVQALILCTMWYYVPDHFEELKFYMYIHQAAVMALDIGITKKKKKVRGSLRGLPPIPTQKRPSVEGPGGDNRQEEGREHHRHPNLSDFGNKLPHPYPLPPPAHPMLKAPFPDSEAIESRRTLLACYWTCCNVSMAQRRPNLLRHTKFMDECLEVLENSPEAAPTDRNLCEWVKLQKIAEEVGIGFAFDDPNANVSIDDARVQFSLKGFGKQLEEWKSKCPEEASQESLELAYHTITIYTHEIALHRDHNVDDFQPPYTESMMREPSIRPNDLLSSCHIDAISRCLSSSHKVLDIFTSMSISAIRSVPVFTYVRISYACIILIKLHFSASHPQSELGKVIDKNSLRVDEHMDKILDTLRKAADSESYRQAQRFTMMLTMMRNWYSKQKSEIERGLSAAPEPTNSFKKLVLGETNYNEGSRTSNDNSSGTGPMEGMETPNSMADVSLAHTPEMGHFHDSMRPPPPRLASLPGATPLHMLSNVAIESTHITGQQYTSIPSPTSSMGMATPRSTSQAPYMGKWSNGIFPMTHGESSRSPGIANDGMHLAHMSGSGGYDIGDHDEVGDGSEGGGEVGTIDYTEEYVPQYVFTGNGEMFMDDTFWAMMGR